MAERRAEPLQHLRQQHHPSPWPRRHQVGKGRTEWLYLPRDGQAAGWGASSRDTQTSVPGGWATVHRLLETWKLSKISTARPFTITGAAHGMIQGRGPLFCPCSAQALSSDMQTHSLFCPGKMQRCLSIEETPPKVTGSALQDISQFRVGPGRSRTSLPLPGGPTLPLPSCRGRLSSDMHSLYICTRVLFTTFKQLYLTGTQADSPAGTVRAGWWQSVSPPVS